MDEQRVLWSYLTICAGVGLIMSVGYGMSLPDPVYMVELYWTGVALVVVGVLTSDIRWPK